MIIVATTGIVVGILLGFVIGQFGVTKPIRTLVACLQRLAKGEAIEIAGAERKDEVGDHRQGGRRYPDDACRAGPPPSRGEGGGRSPCRRGAAGGRAARGGPASRRRRTGGGRPQGDDAPAGGRFRKGRRQHHRDRLDGVDRTGSGRQHPHQDRRHHPATIDRGRFGDGRGLVQCAVGGIGDRRR